MSLKENIGMVKEELNSEEKFFEKAVMTENFLKKYKKYMIGLAVAILVAVVVDFVYESNKAQTVEEANKVLASLDSGTNNVGAPNELKSLSPTLYNVWRYSQAIANSDTHALKSLSKSKTLIVSDLSEYELASSTADSKKLSEYSMKQKAIFKDLALVQNAILYIDKKEIEKAHNELKKIPQDSSLSKVALALLHYGVK